MESPSHDVRVTQLTWEADGVLAVRFRDARGGTLPSWEPGAHLTVHLPNGLAREYSLCSDPADPDGWTVAVLDEADSRGGSRYVHATLRPGDLVRVSGPRNSFALEPAEHYRLVAGGIGITPILAMARELARRGADWQLLYAGRSAASMAFTEELLALGPDRVRLHADDQAGGPPDLAALLAGPEPGTLVYACGPEPLLAAVAAVLDDPGTLRLERFKAPAPVAHDGPDQPFEIVCRASGRVVRVPAGSTALAALAEAGIDVPSSCTEGICGTCETKVLAGRVDHRDYLLTESEKHAGNVMFVCVSRALDPEITLDL
ncbi:MAG: oxidoreductase [Nocardioidaceae bacterium]|nr:oxidoreductase [Nocardioidaceae bacterium]